MNAVQSMTGSDTRSTRLEEKRRETMAAVPAGYSGRQHWASINLLAAAGIAVCVFAVEELVWWEWLFVPAFFVFSNAIVNLPIPLLLAAMLPEIEPVVGVAPRAAV